MSTKHFGWEIQFHLKDLEDLSFVSFFNSSVIAYLTLFYKFSTFTPFMRYNISSIVQNRINTFFISDLGEVYVWGDNAAGQAAIPATTFVSEVTGCPLLGQVIYVSICKDIAVNSWDNLLGRTSFFITKQYDETTIAELNYKIKIYMTGTPYVSIPRSSSNSYHQNIPTEVKNIFPESITKIETAATFAVGLDSKGKFVSTISQQQSLTLLDICTGVHFWAGISSNSSLIYFQRYHWNDAVYSLLWSWNVPANKVVKQIYCSRMDLFIIMQDDSIFKYFVDDSDYVVLQFVPTEIIAGELPIFSIGDNRHVIANAQGAQVYFPTTLDPSISTLPMDQLANIYTLSLYSIPVYSFSFVNVSSILLVYNSTGLFQLSFDKYIPHTSSLYYSRFDQFETGFITSIAASADTSILLDWKGQLYGLGRNNIFGSVGDNSNFVRMTPVSVMSLVQEYEVVFVGTGSFFTQQSGKKQTLYAWGNNGKYQLGFGHTQHQYYPLKVTVSNFLTANQTIVSIEVDDGTTILLASDGILYGVGSNTNGLLANNPDQVVTLTQFSALSMPSKISQVRIANTFFVVAVDISNTTIYGWGYMNWRPFIMYQTVENQKIVKLAVNTDHAFVLLDDYKSLVKIYLNSYGASFQVSNFSIPLLQEDEKIVDMVFGYNTLICLTTEGRLIQATDNAYDFAQDLLQMEFSSHSYLGLKPPLSNLYKTTLQVNKVDSFYFPYSQYFFVSQVPICQQACQHDGICISPNTCHCINGYFGPTCELFTCYNITYNDPKVCSGNGGCLKPNKCSCDAGYEGDTCEIPVCYKIRADQEDVCNGHGNCTAYNQCECQKGFEGLLCETMVRCFGIPYDNHTACDSHGICTATNQCQCNTGYVGNDCSIPLCFSNSTHANSCQNQGICIGVDTCQCREGFIGQRCQLSISAITIPMITISLFIFVIIVIILILIMMLVAVWYIRKWRRKNQQYQMRLLDEMEQELSSDVYVSMLDDTSQLPNNIRIRKQDLSIDYKTVLSKEVNSQSVIVLGHYLSAPVAVKLVDSNQKHDMKQFYNECQILHQYSHHNHIVRFVGVCELSPEQVCLVTEYCQHGTLLQYVTKKQTSFKEKTKLLYQVASALLYLHSNGVVHKDIKVENILVDDNCHVKIIDFGISILVGKQQSKSDSSAMEFITAAYCAPETIRKDLLQKPLTNEESQKEDATEEEEEDYYNSQSASIATDEFSDLSSSNLSSQSTSSSQVVKSNSVVAKECKVDIYSFAIVMWVVFFENAHPYGNQKSDMDIIAQISWNKEFRPKIPSQTVTRENSWFFDLMIWCWEFYPHKRPTMKQVVQVLEQFI